MYKNSNCAYYISTKCLQFTERLLHHLLLLSPGSQMARLCLVDRTRHAHAYVNLAHFTWNSLGHVVLILPAVQLPRLQRAETIGPAAFMGVFHQLCDDVCGATTVNQGAFDDSLQHSIWGGDHAAPARDPRCLQTVDPPVTPKTALKQQSVSGCCTLLFAARLISLAPCHHTHLLEKLHWLPISEYIKVVCMYVSML